MIKRSFYLTACSIILLFVAASGCRAQQVTGQVRYAESNQPAFNVNVHCEGAGTTQIQQTDRNGRFVCRLGSPGNFTVRVDAPGYLQEQQGGTALDANSNEYMFFRLKKNPAEGATLTPLSVVPASPTASADPNVPAQAQKEFSAGIEAVAANKPEKMKEAVQHFEKAVTIYPKFTQAYVALGTAYMDLREWEKAEDALRKAIAIDPKTTNARLALGEIQLRQKKHQEAEKTLLEALASDPRAAYGHLTLGRVYWEMALNLKDEATWRPILEKSYEEAKKSLELDPKLAEAHILKGNLLLRVRRVADAEHEFEEYLRMEPQGRLAEQARTSVERIKKALASEPEKPKP